ncbi:hypothetical protein ACB092_02G024500 [Castanea dentata]
MAGLDLGFINVANFRIHFLPFSSLLFSSLSLFIFSIFSSASPSLKISVSTILFCGIPMAESPWLHQPPSPTPPPPTVLAHVTSYLKAFSSLSLSLSSPNVADLYLI